MTERKGNIITVEQKLNQSKKEISKILPNRLQELRTSLNFSQNYVAEQLCISRQTYSHYETGRITPPVDALCQLADLFQVSIDQLLSHKLKHKPENQYSDSSFRPEEEMDREETEYLNFMGQYKNTVKYANLSENEKHLLFYFLTLDKRDQKDILDFMKLKIANRLSK